MSDLETALTRILGVAPQDHTYYILNTVRYNSQSPTVERLRGSSTTASGRILRGWRSLWDPEFRSHFKRARLFGAPSDRAGLCAWSNSRRRPRSAHHSALWRTSTRGLWITALEEAAIREQDSSFPRLKRQGPLQGAVGRV